jgi:hypothetical protein
MASTMYPSAVSHFCWHDDAFCVYTAWEAADGLR